MEIVSDYVNVLASHLSTIHNPLWIFLIIAIPGVVVGKLFHSFKLPDVSGQVIVGILIGLFLNESQLNSVSCFSDIALGVMTFSIGLHLKYKVLHNSGSRILNLAIFDTLFCFISVLLVLRFFINTLPLAAILVLAAISVATAPGTIISLIQKKYSRGVLTKTLVGVVAFNNFSTIIVFEICMFAGRQFAGDGTAAFGVLNSFFLIAATIVYGIVSGFVVSFLTKHQHGKGDIFSTIAIMIIFNIVVCNYLGLSHLLVNLILGIVFCNSSYHTQKVTDSLENITGILFAVFFTLAGTHLDLSQFKVVGAAGAAFILTRAVAKCLGVFTASRLFKYPKVIANFLGMGLLPQAGLAIGLVMSLRKIPAFADVAPTMTAIVLAAVAANELIGPFITSLSIDFAKETNQATPRLIDFLHEEYILTDLVASDKWEAIKKMTDFLVKTNNLESITREDLLETVIKREKEFTTGVGQKLAIPHAKIPKKEKLVGVIGITHSPIDFESIDNRGVNIIILIATPLGQENLHVKILAAVAKIFTEDPLLQQKLIEASGPAEVYDILQSSEIRDVNAYLEEVE